MQDGVLVSSRGDALKCVTWVAIFKGQLEAKCNYTKNQKLDMLNTSGTCYSPMAEKKIFTIKDWALIFQLKLCLNSFAGSPSQLYKESYMINGFKYNPDR